MIIYTLTDMISAAIFAGLAAALTAGLIVDTWHRRQPPPAAARPAAEPAQAADPYSPEARAQLRQALDALQQMQRSAHAYKELAEGLERSLAEARATAAECRSNVDLAVKHMDDHKARETFWRARAEALSVALQQRTQEALAAGFAIVIDHGDLGRRHHPHREDPQQ